MGSSWEWVYLRQQPGERTSRVEASITHKIIEFASCSGGVIAGDYISCKENQTLMEGEIFQKRRKNHEYGNHYKIEEERYIGLHNQYID